MNYHEFVERLNLILCRLLRSLNLFFEFLTIQVVNLGFCQISLRLIKLDRILLNSFFNLLNFLLKLINLIPSFIQSSKIPVVDIVDIMKHVHNLFSICQVEVHEQLLYSKLKMRVLLLFGQISLNCSISVLRISLQFLKLIIVQDF